MNLWTILGTISGSLILLTAVLWIVTLFISRKDNPAIAQSISDMQLKFLGTVQSTKFWFTLGGMALGGITALQAGGDWRQVVIGVLAAVGIAGTYTVSKTKQNIEFNKVETTPADNYMTTTPDFGYLGQYVGSVAVAADRLAADRSEYQNESDEAPLPLLDFHRAVLDYAKRNYKTVNQATVYYSGQAMGTLSKVASNLALRQYWQYMTSLATAAYEWGEEQLDKTGSCHPRFADILGIRTSTDYTHRAAANLFSVLDAGIDWRAKVGDSNCNYWYVGSAAKEMLGVKPKVK